MLQLTWPQRRVREVESGGEEELEGGVEKEEGGVEEV